MANTRSVLTLNETTLVEDLVEPVEQLVGLASPLTTPRSANFGVDWSAILGDQIKVGVSFGYAISGGASTTVRVRIGGESGGNSSEITGYTVIEEVISGVGRLDAVTDLITKPTDISYVKLTAQNSVLSTVQLFSPTVTIQPEADSSALMLHHRGLMLPGRYEVIVGQWAVDFDLFSTPNLVAAFAGRTLTWSPYFPPSTEGSIYRLRIGGTWGVADGAVVTSFVDNYALNSGRLGGNGASVSCPSGVQLVTVTMELLADWRRYGNMSLDWSVLLQGSGTPTVFRPMITFESDVIAEGGGSGGGGEF